jgi:hypothetical protein
MTHKNSGSNFPSVRIVGMVWYRPETFDVLRAMFEDGDKLPRTYEDWLHKAELGRKQLEASGVKVVCVDLDPEVFRTWCADRGLNIDGAARTEYANSVAYKVAVGGGSGSVQ